MHGRHSCAALGRDSCFRRESSRAARGSPSGLSAGLLARKRSSPAAKGPRAAAGQRRCRRSGRGKKGEGWRMGRGGAEGGGRRDRGPLRALVDREGRARAAGWPATIEDCCGSRRQDHGQRDALPVTDQVALGGGAWSPAGAPQRARGRSFRRPPRRINDAATPAPDRPHRTATRPSLERRHSPGFGRRAAAPRRDPSARRSPLQPCRPDLIAARRRATPATHADPLPQPITNQRFRHRHRHPKPPFLPPTLFYTQTLFLLGAQGSLPPV
jgi:hypothetical protein